MVENKVHSLLSFPAISSVSPAFHNPMMTETFANTPTLSQGDGNQHNRCLHPDALTPPLQDIC